MPEASPPWIGKWLVTCETKIINEKQVKTLGVRDQVKHWMLAVHDIEQLRFPIITIETIHIQTDVNYDISYTAYARIIFF